MDFGRAAKLFGEIVGYDPENAKRFFLHGGLDPVSMCRQVQEAIDLDPSLVTAFFMLDHFAAGYLGHKTFTAQELISDPEGVAAYISKCRELKEILQHPDIRSIGEDFRAKVALAVKNYGGDPADPAMSEVLNDPHLISVLRRDALRSSKNLAVHQFMEGEPGSGSPSVVATIYAFWDINELLTLAPQIPEGVFLTLIKHPEGYHSYFAICVRNGANLMILTDAPKFSHPMQGMMSRRPDRELEARMGRNWFPYDLLKFEYSEDDRLRFKTGTDLVSRQSSLHPLARVNEIDPRELVWFALLVDLIVDRFWKKGERAKALSYTGSMVKTLPMMLESAKEAGLPAVQYKGIEAAPLAVVDVAADTCMEEEIGEKLTQPHRWLEDRYGARVSGETINLVEDSSMPFLLTAETGEVVSKPQSDSIFPSLGGEKPQDLALQPFDKNAFGTREKLLADRKFMARFNFAKGIQRLAEKEHHERALEVFQAWKNMVMGNEKNILSMAVGEDLWVGVPGDDKEQARFGFGGSVCCREEKKLGELGGNAAFVNRHREYRLSQRIDLKGDEWRRRSYQFMKNRCVNFGRDYDDRAHAHRCWVNDTAPSYMIEFKPQCARDLALLAGCDLDQLPDVLQHWTRGKGYFGNSILDRVDPMIWALQNPWLKEGYGVHVYLSKRGMKRLRG